MPRLLKLSLPFKVSELPTGLVLTHYALYNRSKHIQLRWAYISERQQPDVADLQAVPVPVSRTIMLADIFASPRSAASFIPFRNAILGTSRSVVLANVCAHAAAIQ